MAGLYAPLPTLRRHPRGRPRTARGRCGSLLLHRSGLSPPTPCRSPGALTRVAARTLAPSPIRDQLHRRLQPFRHLHDCSGCFRLERLPVGLAPTGKRRLLTAHARSGHSPTAWRIGRIDPRGVATLSGGACPAGVDTSRQYGYPFQSPRLIDGWGSSYAGFPLAGVPLRPASRTKACLICEENSFCLRARGLCSVRPAGDRGGEHQTRPGDFCPPIGCRRRLRLIAPFARRLRNQILAPW